MLFRSINRQSDPTSGSTAASVRGSNRMMFSANGEFAPVTMTSSSGVQITRMGRRYAVARCEFFPGRAQSAPRLSASGAGAVPLENGAVPPSPFPAAAEVEGVVFARGDWAPDDPADSPELGLVRFEG